MYTFKCSIFRFSFKENKEASKQLKETYPSDLVGKIALAIYNHHKDTKIIYELDSESEDIYEHITEKYNGQFNLKYAGTKCLHDINYINVMSLVKMHN